MSEALPKVTVAEVAARYLAQGEANGVWGPAALSQRKQRLGEFVRIYGAMEVKDCKPFHLTDWIESLACVKSTATRKACANQVNACFNWAVQQGRIDKNPLRYVRYAEAEPRPPMPDDVLAQLERVSNKHFENVLRFLRLTGCRFAELCGLTWPDVDLESARAVNRRHKSHRFTHKPKVLYLVPAAVDLLRLIRTTQPADHLGAVFLNTRGTPWKPGVLSKQLRRMKARHGIKEKASLHGLRHAFAIRAVANGAPIKLVAECLGHASSAITERFYAIMSGEGDAIRDAAMLAMPAFERPRPVTQRLQDSYEQFHPLAGVAEAV